MNYCKSLLSGITRIGSMSDDSPQIESPDSAKGFPAYTRQSSEAGTPNTRESAHRMSSYMEQG